MSWRADGIRALHDTTAGQQLCDQELVQIGSDAATMLHPLFSQPGDHTEAMQDFRERIINGAFKLNQHIRTSPVDYDFDLRLMPDEETCPWPLHEIDTDINILIDAENGNKIRRFTGLAYDASESFGQALCVVFPGLSRGDSEGQRLRIGKATILAKLDKNHRPTGVRGLIRNLLKG